MGLRSSIRRKKSRIKYPLEIYKPNKNRVPENLLGIFSIWKGLEQIIEDILIRFDIGRDKWIEFGVKYC